MKEELSHRVLKDLVFKFKETQDQNVFCKILKRIDDLIVFVVNKFVIKHPQYNNVDHQALYNSAIVGLYRGIATAKRSEPPMKIQARLIAYMKCEMLSTCRKVIEKANVTNIIIGMGDTVVSGETVYHDLEVEFLGKRYQKLIDNGIITQLEFDILNMRFVDRAKIKEIAVRIGRHTEWVRRKINDSLNRIRFELRRKNLEDV